MSEKQMPASKDPKVGRKRGKPDAPGTRPKNIRKTVRRLMYLMKPFRLGFAAVILFAILAVLFNTMGPYILGLATNEIVDGFLRMTQGIGGIDFSILGRILLTLGLVYGVSALMSYIQQFILAGVSQKMMYNLRTEIDQKIRRLPLRYFDGNTLGDILSRVTNDVDAVNGAFMQSLPQIVSAVFTIIMVVIAMLNISPLLTLVGLVTFPLSMLFSVQIMKRSQKFFRGQQKELGALGGHVEEMYAGHNVIKAFGREQQVTDRFEEINGRLYGYAWKAQLVSGIMMPVTMFLGNVGYVFVAVVGGLGVVKGTLLVGSVQSFIQYIRQFGQPVSQVASMMSVLQSTVAAAERIFEFLEEEEEPVDCPDPVFPEDPAGNVKLSHIRFGYTPDNVLIKDLSISLSSGDKVAIVGPTGAGKTTLVNLLLRFYDIQGGMITIDGVDIMKMRKEKLRSLFGMVLQDTWLYSGTIADNIRYGRLDATDEEVEDAARAAYADSFIRTLPGGYSLNLGEDAANISQGQKQLLTIARAILSDPVILILDEATSSVDTRTEVLIQKAMNRLMENRTSFVIAHRLSTIRDARVILVMRDGEIVETGNHQDLLEKGGFYAQLYNSQFEGAEE